MDLITSPAEMSDLAEQRRRQGRRQVLVPTMGALHDGHIQLVREGLKRGDDVSVSVFVNPTQFAPGEDFARYPRDLEEDLRRLGALHHDITVFAPSDEDMYAGGRDETVTWVHVDALDTHLCGRHRPGHFRGVTTVVTVLFHVCRPHVAVFGLKDAQQFVILKRMVQDLHFGIEMVGVPTAREEDGLAFSSRNAFLSEDERAQAVVLSRAVAAAERLVMEGEQHPEALVTAMRSEMAAAPLARVQYAEVVDAATLQPMARIHPGDHVLAAVAAYFGETRLIDSVFVRAPVTD